jgi:predicted NUDIX family NTP pyrophosphohydrolase
MAKETSAGVLVYRRGAAGPQFLLAHPGGPYWAGKDEAAWSIPKGLVEPGEDSWAAAQREFEEEIGQPIAGHAIPLNPCRTPGGKVIHAWLVEADLDLSTLASNRFEMEWPRGSGRVQSFPEVDRAAYFPPECALKRIHRGQVPILQDALTRLAVGGVIA